METLPIPLLRIKPEGFLMSFTAGHKQILGNWRLLNVNSQTKKFLFCALYVTKMESYAIFDANIYFKTVDHFFVKEKI